LRELRRTTDPVQLQEWAASILAREKSTTNLAYGELPKELRAMQPAASCCVLVGTAATNSCVVVYWGSGLAGSWGLAIGQPGFVPSQLGAAHLIKWQDGLYVYYSR
jgi:hypothetical protein